MASSLEMTAPPLKRRPQAGQASVEATFGARDAIVLVAMLAIAAAIGVALSLHGDVPVPIAAVAALGAGCILLILHLIAMRLVQPRAGAYRHPLAERSAAPPAEEEEPLAPFRPFVPFGAAPAADPAPLLPPAFEGPSHATASGASAPDPLSEVVRSLAELVPGAHPERRTADASAPVTGAAVYPAPSLGAAVTTAPPLAATSERRIAMAAPPVAAIDHLADVLAAPSAAAAEPELRVAPATSGFAAAQPAIAASPAAAMTVAEAAKLADIADAIKGQRLETALHVVPSLSDERLQHHEIVVRLRTRTGEMLVPDDVVSVGRGAGLLLLLEALKIARALRLASALVAEGCTGALLSAQTADVLLDDRAMQTLLEAVGGPEEDASSAARHVVLSFPQSETRRFTEAHWGRLADLSDMGFRFAIEDIADLRSDFAALRQVGFLFLKLDAATLRQGLASHEGTVAPDAIAQRVGELGMTLIVSRIDSASDLSVLAAMHVPFGQGDLFRVEERVAQIVTGGAATKSAAGRAA